MEQRRTRGKAIRQKCLDCCCGQSAEMRRCALRMCPLWPFRMGNEKLAENQPVAKELRQNDAWI